MARLEPVSYSRLTALEQCPKRFHALNVAKSVREEPSEHQNYGKDVHDSFARYVRDGKALPLHLKQYERYLTAIKAAPGEKLVEQKLAVTKDFEPTGWLDRDVYLRVISDLTVLNIPRGIVWDYKTGKVYDDFTQLKLTGVVMFQLVPELEELQLAFLWTKTRQATKDTMRRDQIPEVWAHFAPRLQRYQDAFDKQEFPPRPNPFCKGCPVKACPYWEPRR